eukprot:2997286-Amphidinium_carterae.1
MIAVRTVVKCCCNFRSGLQTAANCYPSQDQESAPLLHFFSATFHGFVSSEKRLLHTNTV